MGLIYSHIIAREVILHGIKALCFAASNSGTIIPFHYTSRKIIEYKEGETNLVCNIYRSVADDPKATNKTHLVFRETTRSFLYLGQDHIDTRVSMRSCLSCSQCSSHHETSEVTVDMNYFLKHVHILYRQVL